MNNFKNAAIFSAGTAIGVVTGVAMIAKTALKSDAIRKSIADIISNKVLVLLYGETVKVRGGNDKTKHSSYNNDYVSYRDLYNRRSTYDIVFPTKTDGESVINSLKDILNLYGSVSVADLYELESLASTYKDTLVGWTTFDVVNLVRTRDGYLLKLPKPVRIK